MTTSKLVRAAARVLADSDRDDAIVGSPESRARAVSAIEEALRARARWQTRRRWVVGLAIAAGVAALVFGGGLALRQRGAAPTDPATGDGSVAVVAHPSGSGVLVVSPRERQPLADGRLLAEGSRVVTTPQGRAVLALSTGTRITIDAGSELSVVESGAMQRFALGSGTLEADVTKLHAGQRFVIATPDSEVEVHGTSFRVQVLPPQDACANGSRTRVVVRQGVVTVRHAGAVARVAAGTSWPEACAEVAVAGEPRPASIAPVEGGEGPIATVVPSTSRHELAPSAPAHPSVVDVPAAPLPPAPPVAASAPPEADPLPLAVAPLVPEPTPPARTAVVPSLAEQNDAYAVALAALRRGDRRAALSALDGFLARYPAGPLSESATIERLRILARIDRARAAEAARRYLRAYPNGSAREEAQQLVPSSDR